MNMPGILMVVGLCFCWYSFFYLDKASRQKVFARILVFLKTPLGVCLTVLIAGTTAWDCFNTLVFISHSTAQTVEPNTLSGGLNAGITLIDQSIHSKH